MAVFSDFPAVSSSGVPDISVEAVSLTEAPELAITLRYNQNLVKPDIHPSWVGLGWNLAAGGSISRVINDVRDDENSTTLSRKGYYHIFSYYDEDSWASYSKLKENTDKRWGGDVKYDGRPDEFVFSFLGFSGTFYLDHKRAWRVRSAIPFSVEEEYTDGHFSKFTMVDNNGVKYVFGETDASKEWSAALFLSDGVFLPKSWNLTSIVYPNGRVVTFEYERGTTIINPQLWWHFTYYSSSTNSYPQVTRLTGSQIRPSYLKRITGSNFEIVLYRSVAGDLPYNADNMESFRHYYMTNEYWNYYGVGFDGPAFISNHGVSWAGMTKTSVQDFLDAIEFQKLDSISVNRLPGGDRVRIVKFAYTEDSLQRLKLKSVRIDDTNEYKFEYDSALLPPYNSEKVDRWGYFNGRVPDYSDNESFLASKEPDENSSLAETLVSMTLPTGGMIRYEFEGHRFSKELNTLRWTPLIDYNVNLFAGGLRIKRITLLDYDGALANRREYIYSRNPVDGDSVSSGVLGGKSYFTFWPGNPTGSGDVYSSGPASENVAGSHISYSVVGERQSDTGMTVSEFSNFDSGSEFMDQAPVSFMTTPYYRAFSSRVNDRGRILRKTYYRVDMNSLQPIKDEIFTYARAGNEYLRAHYVLFSANLNGIFDYKTTAFTIPVSPVMISKVKSKHYFGASAISDSVEYTYDTITYNLKNVYLRTTRGEDIRIENYYPNDFAISVCQAMADRNILTPVVQTKKHINNILVETRTMTFKDWGSFIMPEEQMVAFGTEPSISLTKILRYDGYANVEEFIDQSKVIHTVLWGYRGLYPVAEILGSSYDQISYAFNKNVLNNEEGGYSNEDIEIELNKVRAAASDTAQVATVLYLPLVGPISKGDVNGKKTYFEYDSSGRLIIIRDNSGDIISGYDYQFRR